MKFLYYFLHWTWGLVPNIVAGIIALILKICGAEVSKFRNSICVQTKYDWGGSFSLGMFIFMGKDCDSSKPHEYGHTIQCMGWGILFIFIIALPSVIRYWYREIIYKTNKEKYYNLPAYDSIWFEHQATQLGNKAVDNKIKGM